MWRNLFVVLLGLVYVALPWDFIPDMVFGLGWLDDSVALFFMWRAIREFMAMRRTRAEERAGQEPFSGDAETGYGGGKTAPRDPREVLGVGPDAGPEEIRRAYRQQANRYHPDKVEHLGVEFRELAERRFKEIQAAYRELTA